MEDNHETSNGWWMDRRTNIHAIIFLGIILVGGVLLSIPIEQMIVPASTKPVVQSF